jgi:hypothetical protein
VLYSTPTTAYHGAWPVEPLPDPLPAAAADGEPHFTVNTTVHFWSAAPVSGTLRQTPFLEPFIYKNDHVAKTGSGQT